MNKMKGLLQDAIDEIVMIPNEKGKNRILATSSMVKLVAYLIATRTQKYGVKFASTENITALLVDVIWANLNNRDLVCKYDDIEF